MQLEAVFSKEFALKPENPLVFTTHGFGQTAEIVCQNLFYAYTYHALPNTFYFRKDAAMAHKDTDFKKIKKLIDIMKTNDLVEVEIKHGDDKILLKRSQPQQPIVTAVPMAGSGIPAVSASGQPTVAPATESAQPTDGQDDGLVEVKSPIVGTFYATATPDSDPYVEVGLPVEPQTVVGIVEAMKVMNEIKAETSGTLAEVLVSNGQAVEYGQVLFKVKPD